MTRVPSSAPEAAPVRAGEELDIAAVDRWLKQQLPALSGSPRITQYAGGASNWTYRLEYDNDDLILRRPPAGRKAKSAHDMRREYTIQKAIKPFFPLVAEMRAFCDDLSVIGSEFYVMERIDGIIPRHNLPSGVHLTEEETRRLCVSALETLVALHAIDYRAAGLEGVGAGSGYIRRQVEGWTRRYDEARTWNVPRGTRIVAWMKGNIPSRERLCVVHNDFRFDNLVLDRTDPTRVLGVLDWEMATIGDPLMDLGNSLAYWVEASDDFVARSMRRQPTHLPGMLTRREVVDFYCERTGVDPGDWTFYEVYGLFRLSAIAQQIYYRYHHKQTRNPAFRHFWFFVHYLHRRCMKAIRRRG